MTDKTAPKTEEQTAAETIKRQLPLVQLRMDFLRDPEQASFKWEQASGGIYERWFRGNFDNLVAIVAKATGADLTFALPDAKIGIMNANLAAKIIADGKSADEIAAVAKEYDALQNSVASAAARGYIDQIVEPADLRKHLIGAMEVLYSKREDRPLKKHGTV